MNVMPSSQMVEGSEICLDSSTVEDEDITVLGNIGKLYLSNTTLHLRGL
jgi:hypothetical protein